MRTINLFDDNGIDLSPVSGYQFPPKTVVVVKNKNPFNGITIVTDKQIVKGTAKTIKSTKKVAWLSEPKVVYDQVYRKIIPQEKLFDLIMTYDAGLLKRGLKYVLVPVGSTWIPISNHELYEKTKLVSSIVSKKNMFPGHKIRHAMCDTYKNIDYYGTKFEYISTKDIGLKDYMFSVAIENSSVPNYFTEKIIDCFLCGCVPVYWGCTNIQKFFNPNGIITFQNVNDLGQKLKELNRKKYNQMIPAIKDNFERAKKYVVMFDWINENIFNKNFC